MFISHIYNIYVVISYHHRIRPKNITENVAVIRLEPVTSWYLPKQLNLAARLTNNWLTLDRFIQATFLFALW